MRMSRVALLSLLAMMGTGGAAAQVNVLGPCRDGFRWTATAAGRAPVATYAECRPEQPFVTITCGGGGYWMRVDRPFTAIEPDSRINEVLRVDDSEFPVLMQTGRSEIPGYRFVEFRLGEDGLRALSTGFRARLDVRGEVTEMHLAGSFDALGILSRRC